MLCIKNRILNYLNLTKEVIEKTDMKQTNSNSVSRPNRASVVFTGKVQGKMRFNPTHFQRTEK